MDPIITYLKKGSLLEYNKTTHKIVYKLARYCLLPDSKLTNDPSLDHTSYVSTLYRLKECIASFTSKFVAPTLAEGHSHTGTSPNDTDGRR